MLILFIERTKGLEHYVENEILNEFNIDWHFVDGLSKDKKRCLILHWSCSELFLFRFYNLNGFWDIRKESFRDFCEAGAVRVWQENSMYPKPGDVRRWLEKIT